VQKQRLVLRGPKSAEFGVPATELGRAPSEIGQTPSEIAPPAPISAHRVNVKENIAREYNLTNINTVNKHK